MSDFKPLTEDQVISRLKKIPNSQTEIARSLHCSRAFVNQVIKSRRSRPTQRMLDLIGVERRSVYVEKGTFPEAFAIPGDEPK